MSNKIEELINRVAAIWVKNGGNLEEFWEAALIIEEKIQKELEVLKQS